MPNVGIQLSTRSPGSRRETDNHVEDFVRAVADDNVLGGEPGVLGEGGA